MDRTSKTVRRMDRPETRYVKVSEAYVAYQVFGDGPLDLLYFHGLGSHFEHFWDLPMYAQLLGRLADFSRVIIFDRRGTGGSDDCPCAATPTWEEWTQDVRAVLDAAGSNRTAIVAAGDAGPIAILFAAMNPGRVSALVLFNSSSRYLIANDYPIGMRPEIVDAFIERVRTTWGTPEWVRTSTATWGATPKSAGASPGCSAPPPLRAWRTNPIPTTSFTTSMSERRSRSSRFRPWCCTSKGLHVRP